MAETVDARLRRNINALIRQRGVMKNRVARAATRSDAWLSGYLAGKHPFPLENIEGVALLFNVDPQWLLSGDAEKEYAENGGKIASGM